MNDKTVDELTVDATAGDASAQYELGEKYYYGDGVLINHDTALKWYKMAAYQGVQSRDKIV